MPFEILEVVCVESRTDARCLAEHSGNLFLALCRCVLGLLLVPADSLCAVVDRPQFLEYLPLALTYVQSGAYGIGNIGIQRLVDFSVLFPYGRFQLVVKETALLEQQQEEQGIFGLESLW